MVTQKETDAERKKEGVARVGNVVLKETFSD